MTSDIYETMQKFQAAKHGGLDIRLEDLLEVANRDPYIDITSLYERAIDHATRRQAQTTPRAELELLRHQWHGTIAGKGGDCPVCDRWGKIYKRPISVSMVKGFMWLALHLGDSPDFVGVPDTAPEWMKRTYAFANLRYWGLLERKALGEDEEDKGTSGLWRLTDKGKQWLNRQIAVPKAAWIYNNRVLQFVQPDVFIDEPLKGKFSYSELMAGRFDGLEGDEA